MNSRFSEKRAVEFFKTTVYNSTLFDDQDPFDYEFLMECIAAEEFKVETKPHSPP